MIKEYFANYFLHMSDVTFDMVNNRMDGAPQARRTLARHLVDTGDGNHDRRAPQARRPT
jgi:glucose-1-phosphate cytidylyltransferase